MYTKAIFIAAGLTALFIVLHLIVTLAKRSGRRRPGLGLWASLVYLVLLASTGVLAGTAFYGVIAHGAMRGWALWLHLSAAGAFVVALPLAALTWAGACRSACCCGVHCEEDAARLRFAPLSKVTFWLVILAGTLSLGTMLASMVPILGTDGIEQMIAIHRYSGLVVVAALIVHVYSTILGRLAPA